MRRWLGSSLAILLVSAVSAASREPVPLVLELQQADAVGLLQLTANLVGKPTIIVRPDGETRQDFPRQEFHVAELQTRVGASLGLHRVDAGPLALWVPECAKPEIRTLNMPGSSAVTINFPELPAAVLLNLLADVDGRELSAPDGFPDVLLSVGIESRTTNEIGAAVQAALGLSLQVVEGKLLVRRARPAAGCTPAFPEWVADESRLKRLAGPRFEASTNCGRLRKFPASRDTKCKWYESSPRANFHFRGYVAFSPRSPLQAYVEPPGSPSLLAMPGWQFSEEFLAIAEVRRDRVELTQFETGPSKPKTARAFSVFYDDQRSVDRKPGVDDTFLGYERERLEAFALEDLLVESTSKSGDHWTATIRTVHGQPADVKRGYFLGPDLGRIVGIDADGLDLVQIVPDGLGGYRENAVRLQKGAWYEHPRDVLRRKLALPEISSSLQKRFVDAAAGNALGVLEETRARGADIDATEDGVNALFAAILHVKYDTTEVVRWLLKEGARPDGFFQKYETTPLIEAVERGSLEMTRLLLDAGATPDLTDARECTPLYYAAQLGELEIAKLLLARGADPRAQSGIGLTPFTIAAYRGHRDVLALLMKAGVRLEDRDRNGQTMLNGAVQGGNRDTVRFLIDRGANVNATDNQGKSILDLRRPDDREIEALLLARGAKSNAGARAAPGED